MTLFEFRVPASAIAVLLTTTAAHAELTAKQVWDSWKAQMGIYGESGISIGGESLVDGVLTVSGLTLQTTNDTGDMTGDLGDMIFTELGDGTVEVTMAESMTFAVNSETGMGAATAMNVTVTQADMSIVASGTPEAIEYEVSATRYAILVGDLVTNGQPTDGSFMFGLNDLGGTYSTTGTDDLMAVIYAMDAGSMDMLIDMIDPESGNDINITGTLQDLSMTADAEIPLAAMAAAGDSPDPAFPPGLSVDAGYSFGPSNYVVNVVEDGMATAATADIAAGEFDVVLNEGAVEVAMSTTGLNLTMTVPMLPVPVTVSLAGYGASLAMPMAADAAPQDFGMALNLTDLMVSDDLWAMLDPGVILPRDPASVVLDVSGTMMVLSNLMDPAAQAEMAATGAPPALPVTVDLNELLVRFGGAEITGSGAFTFDATDTTTYAGTPLPIGSIDLAINGANGLMDKLVLMGLIPEDQVMMGKMMLGMFAVPAGDDMLTSTIEFTPDGGILANGNQIQ